MSKECGGTPKKKKKKSLDLSTNELQMIFFFVHHFLSALY